MQTSGAEIKILFYPLFLLVDISTHYSIEIGLCLQQGIENSREDQDNEKAA